MRVQRGGNRGGFSTPRGGGGFRGGRGGTPGSAGRFNGRGGGGGFNKFRGGGSPRGGGGGGFSPRGFSPRGGFRGGNRGIRGGRGRGGGGKFDKSPQVNGKKKYNSEEDASDDEEMDEEIEMKPQKAKKQSAQKPQKKPAGSDDEEEEDSDEDMDDEDLDDEDLSDEEESDAEDGTPKKPVAVVAKTSENKSAKKPENKAAQKLQKKLPGSDDEEEDSEDMDDEDLDDEDLSDEESNAEDETPKKPVAVVAKKPENKSAQKPEKKPAGSDDEEDDSDDMDDEDLDDEDLSDEDLDDEETDAEDESPKKPAAVIAKKPETATPAAKKGVQKVEPPKQQQSPQKPIEKQKQEPNKKPETPKAKPEQLKQQQKPVEQKQAGGKKRTSSETQDNSVEPPNKKQKPSVQADKNVVSEQVERQKQRDKCSLFIKNLPRHCKDSDVSALSTDILNFRRVSKNCRYGWIAFATEQICEKNFEKLKDVTIGGSKVNIDFVGEKSTYSGRPSSPTKDAQKINPLELYIGGIAIEDCLGELKTIFPKAAEFTMPARKRPGDKKFAFAIFTSAQDAREAFDKSKDLKVGGVNVHVSYARAKSQDAARKAVVQKNKDAAKGKQEAVKKAFFKEQK